MATFLGNFEVIAGRTAQERRSATWIQLQDTGKPRKTSIQLPECTLTSSLQSGVQAHEP
jgi:hypothetical protein